ncbi:KICSTOR complex protein ITFG2-like [Oscarella lobularis]|uniref:KICSTOR complex protein ITFG2-like n=1 Tax=Oscarella lobularis TaxID=121494 RepID=UPI0033136355
MKRSVCFVNRVELHFKGNVFSQALCLGDVDNDGRNECIVGNVEGSLAVFKKGDRDKPWRSCSDLGMIACVGVGDLCRIKKNILVCIASEGLCHVFYLEKEFEDHRGDMKPFYTQRVPANIRSLLLADIVGDGICRLVVGHTDRIVRVYEWDPGSVSEKEPIAGSMVMIKKWSLEAQVGSLSVSDGGANGSPLLIVSHPGGNYVHLAFESSEMKSTEEEPESVQLKPSQPITVKRRTRISESDGIFTSSPHSSLLVGSSSVASRVATEILGSIHSKKIFDENQRLTAVCTLDGSLQLFCGRSLLWELHVNHQLFALAKVDITNDGNEEIVACAWDGRTYIVDTDRNAVTYQFDENVAAFTAGQYCVDTQNVSCLVYATFSNRLYIYYDVTLPTIKATAFDISSLLEKYPRLQDRINRGVVSKREVVECCIYGDARREETLLKKLEDSA